MSKCKQCVDKSLNFIKAHCIRKTNKLVYTDYPKFPRGHCEPIYVPVIYKGCGTKIRYCTAAEIKKMAGPRMCDCPHQNEDFTMAKLLTNILLTGLKAAGIFTMVYTMIDLGVWGIPQQTQDTFAGICNAMPCKLDPCKDYNYKPTSMECVETMDLLRVSPDNPCACDDPIPINSEMCKYKMRQAWNCMVVCFFESVRDFPDNAINLVHDVWVRFINKPCPNENCKAIAKEETFMEDTCQLGEDEKCDVDPCAFDADEEIVEMGIVEEAELKPGAPCGAMPIKEEEVDESKLDCD